MLQNAFRGAYSDTLDTTYVSGSQTLCSHGPPLTKVLVLRTPNLNFRDQVGQCNGDVWLPRS